MLKAVIMAECDGAPHEFRGVYRGGLLRTLQSGVPSDCIQYNSAVQSVVQDEDGEPVMLHQPLIKTGLQASFLDTGPKASKFSTVSFYGMPCVYLQRGAFGCCCQL